MSIGSLSGFFLLVLLSPALPGICARTTAILTGRRGAPILQPYRDLVRLARKELIYSSTTTWIFRITPYMLVLLSLGAASLLPLGSSTSIVGFTGDLILFAGLLAFGRFFLTLSGMDTGSSFEGMGVSRELGLACLTEPALFLCFAALALATRGLSLSSMLGHHLSEAWRLAPASLVMVTSALLILLLAEAARVPVDDPATHLELTMIHEVIILDSSGPDLAAILYAGALRFGLFAAILTGLVWPRSEAAWPLQLGGLALGLLLVAVTVGVIESVTARLRMLFLPQLLVSASILGVLATFLLII